MKDLKKSLLAAMENIEVYEAKIQQFEEKKSDLQRLHEYEAILNQVHAKTRDESLRKRIERLMDIAPIDREYMFNFKQGGWNTVIAKDKSMAIKKALAEYDCIETLDPLVNTFRECGFAERLAALRGDHGYHLGV